MSALGLPPPPVPPGSAIETGVSADPRGGTRKKGIPDEACENDHEEEEEEDPPTSTISSCTTASSVTEKLL